MAFPIKQAGRFQTNQGRVIHITHHSEARTPEFPGGAALPRKVWIGVLYKSDGKTVDTEGMWETSGRYTTPKGVAHPYDAAMFMRFDPPVEAARAQALADGTPLAEAVEVPAGPSVALLDAKARAVAWAKANAPAPSAPPAPPKKEAEKPSKPAA